MSTVVAPPRVPAAARPATPFVGLVPYSEEDAAFFFGREQETEIVAGNLRAARLTILYGPSGVGKTSLLRAGVVHDLRARVRRTAVSRPERAPFGIAIVSAWRENPMGTVMEAVRASVGEALGGDAPEGARADETPVDALRRWTERVRTLLVVLDQFEDYFLYHPDDDDFALTLPEIVNEPNLRVNVLVSLREDAWAKLDRFEGQIPRLFGNYIRVEHLTRDAGRAAIEKPVDEWNRRRGEDDQPYRVDGRLIDAVLDAAAAGRGLVTAEAVGSEALAGGNGHRDVDEGIEAPFLQLVMERLWRSVVASGGHALTRAELDELGGAQRVVQNHLLESLSTLSPAERDVAADLFRFLVTRAHTKVSHSAASLAEWTRRPEPEVTAILERLCRGDAGRILRGVPSESPDGPTSYELFHDVLAEPVLDWRRAHDRERERRRAIRIGAALVVLVAVFATIALIALQQSREASKSRANAERLALAASADAQFPTHLDNALLLGLAAARADPSAAPANSTLSALQTVRRQGIGQFLHGHTDAVRGVAYAGNGRTLVSAGDDGTVRLWDIERRRPPAVIDTKVGRVNGLAVDGVGSILVAGGDAGRAAVWSVATRRSIETIPGRSPILGVALSPDGRMIAIARQDGSVSRWDVRLRRAVGRTLRMRGDASMVAFSPDGRTLAAGGTRTDPSGDTSLGELRLWEASSGEPIRAPITTRATPGAIAFSPDGSRLAIGTDGSVDVRSARTGQRLRGGVAVDDFVEAVAYSPDGRRLAAIVHSSLQVWDARNYRALGRPRRLGQPFHALAFAPDGRRVAAGLDDGTIAVLNEPSADSGQKSLSGHRQLGLGVAFSPDGQVLATQDVSGLIRLWRTGALTPIQTGRAHFPAYGVAFSTAGDVLAVGEPDGVQLLGVRGPAPLRSLRVRHPGSCAFVLGFKRQSGPACGVKAVAFSPNGSMLAAAAGDGAVHLWNTRGWRERPPLRVSTGVVWSVAFSPDGRVLAAGTYDGVVRLYDMPSGTPLGRIPIRAAGRVLSVAFSGDGRTLAVPGAFDTVRLWDLRTRRPTTVLPRQGLTVESLAYSPDGITLAVAGIQAVRLWNTETGQAIGRPMPAEGEVRSIAFSPNGRTLAAAGGFDTEVAAMTVFPNLLWRTPKQLEAVVCPLVTGDVSRREWGRLTGHRLKYHRICPP